jgi:hypothetical protein
MKSLILFLFAIHYNITPGELFFSEYIEGNSNNKALEIFNPGNSPVELTNYRIVQSVNGGGWKDYHIFPEGATILPQSVFTIIHGKVSSELFNHNLANEISTSAVVSFNGNDARGLIKITGSDTILVDVIGLPDQDPGNGWAVGGINNATMNKTLIRKAHIIAGNASWNQSAGSDSDNSEWIVMTVDYFQNLGVHDFIPLVSNPVERVKTKIFPNPANDFILVDIDYTINSLVITDIIGRTYITSSQIDFTGKIDISNLSPGMYFLTINSKNASETIIFIKKL